jgi:hypothetical protein
MCPPESKDGWGNRKTTFILTFKDGRKAVSESIEDLEHFGFHTRIGMSSR